MGDRQIDYIHGVGVGVCLGISLTFLIYYLVGSVV